MSAIKRLKPQMLFEAIALSSLMPKPAYANTPAKPSLPNFAMRLSGAMVRATAL